MNELSKERVVNALKGYGLSETDAQVYIFLANNGPNDLRNIALALGLRQKKAQGSIKHLIHMTVLKASIQQPLEFVAASFEEVLDLFIKLKKEQAKAIRESREELLSTWRSMKEKDSLKN